MNTTQALAAIVTRLHDRADSASQTEWNPMTSLDEYIVQMARAAERSATLREVAYYVEDLAADIETLVTR